MLVLTMGRRACLGDAFAAWLDLNGHVHVPCDDEAALLAEAAMRPVDVVVVDVVDCASTAAAAARVRALRDRLRGTLGRDWVPVIALAGGDGEDERIALFDAGADHCVSTPVDGAELRARLRVCARRRFGVGADPVRRGPLALDTFRGTVHCDGLPVPLTRSEVLLLEHLIAGRGRCVDKERLVDALRDHGFEPSLNMVEVHVARMRRKLPPGGPRIAGVRRLGYRLA